MKRISFIALSLVFVATLFQVTCWGATLEEIIFNITLSGGLSAGLDFSINLDDHTYLRTGLNLGIDVCTPHPQFFLWGRLVYLFSVNPQSKLSFYGGGGLSGLLALTGQIPHLKFFPEADLGLKYRATDVISLSGELRFYLPPSDQQSRNKIHLIGFNSGIGLLTE